ncbi:Uncharacterised protein [Chryseobacterium nakagawai]|uniref:Uncharacterized protein n=1 Tax=Chryseobacterium nakagawai TaxID=1241982 RepID=A0AAD1DQN6_CHRNA|nr:hypothetical protein [Chryseobacterium nakagawai]AZA90963.1 hypothetical protein EG343_10110 [Chryseobacterium nakagawai]VEH22507.1 Uncharacterised protein [Chryseobacterium nakagawai]
MIYLSAQPDEKYFLWQLEIQLLNFRKLSISREHIHVIIGYDPDKGISKDALLFKENEEENALIFFYPDTRKEKKYLSSIRPNILKQHWLEFGYLSESCVFYHDSDIIFSKKIDNLDYLAQTEICYVSDTRDYTGAHTIIENAGIEALKTMAHVVGINVELIIENDKEVGGAQYMLKLVDAGFWDKLESDSEKLYSVIQQINHDKWEREYETHKVSRLNVKIIDPWLSDMWGLLWNLWLIGKKVEVREELHFSWINSTLEEWEKNAILHYTGSPENNTTKIFQKGKYITYAPWYDDFSTISKENCSFPVVNLIIEKRKELDKKRIDFSSVEVLLSCDEINDYILKLYSVQTKYLSKFFKFDSILLFSKSENKLMKLTKNGIEVPIAEYSRTLEKIRLEFPIQYILKKEDLFSLLNDAQFHNQSLCFEEIYAVDLIFMEQFLKVMDDHLFNINVDKFYRYEEEGESHISVINDSFVQDESVKSFFFPLQAYYVPMETL